MTRTRTLIPISLVLMLLTGLVPVRPQIFLPHRHAVSPPVAGGFSNPDCGAPPVSTNLIQWLCANALAGTGTVTNWADISPNGVSGVYWTNLFSTTTKPILHTGGSNGKKYLSFGDSTHWAPLANSNNWWNGVSEAQIYYVMDIAGATWSDAGIETLGSSGANEFLWSAASGNQAQLGFGTTVRKDLGFGFRGWNGTFILSMWSKASDWGVATNGVTCFSTNVNTVGFPATAGGGLLTFSMPSGYEVPFNLYEVLVFTNKLTGTATDTNVVAFLKGKYGL